MIKKLVLSVLFLGATLSGPLMTSAVAESAPKHIKTVRHWAVYKYNEGKSQVCFVASQPTKSKGKYKRRGQVVFMVTYRVSGGKNTIGEVSFASGYPFPKNGSVSVTIDGKSFELSITRGETAWATNPDVDAKILAAMKKGSNMTIKGKSQKGTATTDTISLSGVTAATKEAVKRCGVK